MALKEMLWTLEPHTVGKHEVFRRYLDAWLPIVSQSRAQVMTIVDGFAGPGRYARGEEGSPLIALRALAKHPKKDAIEQKLRLVFIESRKERHEALRGNIGQYLSLMPKLAIITQFGEFDDVANRMLDDVDAGKLLLGPSFFMIDPFGVKGVRMETIRRILLHKSAEVYISFQFEPFERFNQHPNFEIPLDELFGCAEWRDQTKLDNYEQMKHGVYSLFTKQLKDVAGAVHVLRFELYEGNNNLKYALFFATGNETGCDRMKQAMWKVAPFGDFAFRGGRLGQVHLGLEPDTTVLRRELIEQFGLGQWVRIEELDRFVRSDATMFHSGHLKTRTLQPMERESRLVAVRPRGRGFPDGTRIKFLDVPREAVPETPTDQARLFS